MDSYWETSWGLASKLVDLVWSNKAPIPNFSFLGSLFTTILGMGVDGSGGGLGGGVCGNYKI